MLYAAETWTLNADVRTLLVFEMKTKVVMLGMTDETSPSSSSAMER